MSEGKKLVSEEMEKRKNAVKEKCKKKD